MILAPLRGVTIRCFREVFADIIREAGFTEAVTPFIPAMAGSDPLKDRELRDQGSGIRDRGSGIRVTPQFIGKDPVALRECLEKVKAAGFETADLNAGCPYPMVRNKGRGSGLLRTPDVLRRMLEVGCEVMGAGMGGVGQTVVPSLADVPHGAASCCLGGLDVLVVAVSDDDRLRWFYPEGFDS